MNCRFILHVLAVLDSAITKAICVGFLLGTAADAASPTYDNYWSTDSTKIPKVASCLLLIFLPNMILSLLSIAKATGCNKTFFEVIFRYPAIWMLPMATYFVIGPQDFKICKCSCNNDSVHQPRLGLSGNLTALNAMLIFICYFPTMLIPIFVIGLKAWQGYVWQILFLLSFIPFLICGWSCTGCSFECCCNPDCYKSDVQCMNIDKNGKRIEIRQPRLCENGE